MKFSEHNHDAPSIGIHIHISTTFAEHFLEHALRLDCEKAGRERLLKGLSFPPSIDTSVASVGESGPRQQHHGREVRGCRVVVRETVEQLEDVGRD